jgi:hypothetical protein
MPPQAGSSAEGVQRAGQIMAAATGARWPMYLRNVKQILRAANFDERQYAFGGLMDLLKACQRENLIRIERDRRGGLRVFQGAAMPRSTPASELAGADITTVEAVVTSEPDEPDVIEVEPIAVVDTTAELLGRAKPRRPRPRTVSSRSAAAPAAPRVPRAGTRKIATKKPAAARRTSRAKKSAAEAPDEPGNS